MNLVVAIAFFFTAFFRLENEFYSDFLPSTLILSSLIIPIATGLYFIRQESALEIGVFRLIRDGMHLSKEQKMIGSYAFKALQDSLFSAGLFSWTVIILISSGEKADIITYLPIYQGFSIITIAPFISFTLMRGLLNFLVKWRTGNSPEFECANNSWFYWQRLLIVLLLANINAFPYESGDSAIFMALSFPAAAILLFSFRFVKNKYLLRAGKKS